MKPTPTYAVAINTSSGALGYITNPHNPLRTFNPAKAHVFPDRTSADLFIASARRKNAHRARNLFVVEHPAPLLL